MSDASDIQKAIESGWSAASKGDYFGVLGISSNAPVAKVQEGYFSLAKLLHPDRVASSGVDDATRQRALTVFKFATEAKDVLSDKSKRARFLAGDLEPTRLASSGESKGGRGGGRNKSELAKIAFHKGSVMLNKRAYKEAEVYLKEAADAKPDEAKHWQKLGWAIFQNSDARPQQKRLEEAREAWSKAIEINHDDAQTHYYMALFHKAVLEMDQCRGSLEQALFLDKNHVEAKRELRLLKMRTGGRRKARRDSNIFQRLMGSLQKKKKRKKR